MASSHVIRRELQVELENGLHMLPCSAIAKAAQEFGGAVRVIHGKTTADASSVLELLGLGAGRGTQLTVEVDGDGADRLLDKLAQVLQNNHNLSR
ncbi:MAG: HPr family phosphocarrier protein [Planctomycetaceae bacterium]